MNSALGWNYRDRWLVSKNGCLSTKKSNGHISPTIYVGENHLTSTWADVWFLFFYHFCRPVHFLNLLEMEAVFSMNNNNVSHLSSACVPSVELSTLPASFYFFQLCGFAQYFFPLCFNIVFSCPKTLLRLCDSSLSEIVWISQGPLAPFYRWVNWTSDELSQQRAGKTQTQIQAYALSAASLTDWDPFFAEKEGDIFKF